MPVVTASCDVVFALIVAAAVVDICLDVVLVGITKKIHHSVSILKMIYVIIDYVL